MSAAVVTAPTDPRAEAARLTDKIAECRSQEERHTRIIEALPLAQTELTSLHARRTAGEKVTDKTIATAESNLRNAGVMAETSRLARAGVAEARAQFEQQLAAVATEIRDRQAAAKRRFAELLIAKVHASRAAHVSECEAFAVGAHAAHHGLVAAAAEFAVRHDLGAVDAHPCGIAAIPEFVVAPAAGIDFALHGCDARAAIAKYQAAVTAELEAALAAAIAEAV